MSRRVAVVLVLTVAFAPTTSARVWVDQQEESFSFSRWLQPVGGVLDWHASRRPTIRSTSQNVGAMIDPSGVAETPTPTPPGVPLGKGSGAQQVGAMIDPSG